MLSFLITPHFSLSNLETRNGKEETDIINEETEGRWSLREQWVKMRQGRERNRGHSM